MPAVEDQIVATAQVYGVDPNLALRVAGRESGFHPEARGAAGEIGVFQLLPATAADLGVDPYDLADNIRGGVMYLRQLIDQFGDLIPAVAAYNWGPGRVAAAISQWGVDWLTHAPGSVQAYVSGILQTSAMPVFRTTVTSTALLPGWAIALVLLLGVLVWQRS